MKYNENQSAYWIMILLLCAMLLPVAMVVFSGEEVPEDSSIIAGVVLISCVLIALLFFKLKTEVSEKEIRLSFGIGLIRKTIDLSTVKSVEVVRNKWYYGWGIRLIQNGWMWNITGLDGVELTFKDKTRVFRIGSQDSLRLKAHIETQITR